MAVETIISDFKRKVCDKVRVEPEGLGRYRVFTPFLHEDGDHLAIVLRREGDQWLLSDEGNTYMRLTYDLDEADLRKGTRARIITNALDAFSVHDRNGELVVPCEGNAWGDALYSFIQALLKVNDVKFLAREHVKSTFMEDFRTLVSEHVPETRRVFDWHDQVNDPDGKYPVDCRINGLPRPLMVFALPNDDKTSVATITLLQLERWNRNHKAVGIFETQEDIGRKTLARFSDVCDKQFSNLAGNRDRVARYLKEEIERP